MIVDGRAIAERIYAEIRTKTEMFFRIPRLTIITCAPNFETQKYLALKEKKAKEVGIEIHIVNMSIESATEDFIVHINKGVEESDGVIVQLPLPAHIDTKAVLSTIPESHDVDALNLEHPQTLSPVVGAIREILNTHKVFVAGKQVTVIGNGRLVGLPSSQWFTSQGAHVSVVTKDTPDIAQYTRIADVVVCGAGIPGLLTPEMVKEGVIILDAGTSEDGGVLRGDADPSCADKASLFTPVPGGIGPITVAILLKNVFDCAIKR